MPTMKAKEQPVLLGLAFAIAFGSFVLAPPASADGCVAIPRGGGYTGMCTNGGGPSLNYFGPMSTGTQNSVGTVDGIYCTIKNAHRCRAHLQNGGTYVP